MRSIFIHLFSALIVFSAFNCYAKNVAVIIGVSEFADQEVPDLPTVYNDAKLMTETLSNFSTEPFEIHRVYALREKIPNWNDPTVDDSDKKVTNINGITNVLPTKKNILSEIKNALTGLSQNDFVLIYISSHGIIGNTDEATGMILACDSTMNNHDSCIQPKKDIREELLKNNPAGHKLLILDACGAAAKRGMTPSKDITGMTVSKFREDIISDGISNVITLASCGITQSSNLLNEKSLSLYTYWLVCGLKGYADTSKDGCVTTNELIEYIKTNIQIMGVDQSPTAIYEIKNTTHFTVIKPQFENHEAALNDLADQIIFQLQIRKLKDVSIENVVMSDADIKSSNTPDYNSFLSYQSNYCSKKLKKCLEDKCTPNDIVVKSMETHNDASATTIYTKLHCTPDFKNPSSIDNYELQCHIETNSVPADFSVRFSMPKAEQALVNNNNSQANAQVAPANNPSVNTTVPYKQLDALEFKTTNEQVAQVLFFVNGKQRPIYLIEGVPYLPLNEGDKYEIKVVNNLGKDLDGKQIPGNLGVLMGRILVDGKNTLPQKPEVTQTISKALVSVNDKGETVQYGTAKLRIAANQNVAPPAPAPAPEPAPEPGIDTRIGTARAWTFETNDTFPIKGFNKSDANGNIIGYNEFIVSKVADNVKPEEYNPDLGLITIALYRGVPAKPVKPDKRDRGVGGFLKTDEGQFHNQKLRKSSYEIGEQLDSVQIRYATEKAINNIIQELTNKPQLKPGTMRSLIPEQLNPEQ